MKNAFMLLLVVLQSSRMLAQTNKQLDTLSRFYNSNYFNFIDKDFDKTQFPLDGAEVDMIPFRDGELFGFIDKQTEKLIIKPQYLQVHCVHKEGAIVKSENGYGMVDRNNKSIIPIQFRQLTKENGIYTGLLSVVDTNIKEEMYNSVLLSMHFNEEGKFLFYEKSHDFKLFQQEDTLAWFRYGKEYHIRSKTGALLKTFRYNEQISFIGICNNLLVFKDVDNEAQKSNYSAVDLGDKVKFKISLEARGIDGVYQLSDNLFAYYSEDGDFFFADKKGNDKPYGIVSESVGFFKYNGDFFSGNKFVVRDFETENYGIVNREGDTILPFTHKFLYQIGNDTYLIEQGAIINSNGKELYSFHYDGVSLEFLNYANQSFLPGNNLFVVKAHKRFKEKEVNGKITEYFTNDDFVFYYSDTSGKVKFELPEGIAFASQFSDGFAAIVDSNRKLGFIDTSGKIVIKPEYELSMAGAYPFPYLITPYFRNGYAYIKSHKGYINRKGKKYFIGKQIQDHYNFSH